MANTIQKCNRCGKDVIIDFLNFLLSLDKEIICKECKKEK